MVGPHPKEKRRNSEKRKEKSRDAARSRRGKESEIFADLAHALPLPSSVSSQLDKASVMRLTIAYLKAQSLLDNVPINAKGGPAHENHAADALLLKALEGFLLVLSQEGDIVYLSENVSQHLGLAQIDLIGQSIYEFSHPCDHDEIKEVLSLRVTSVNNNHPNAAAVSLPLTTPESRSFFLRLKCTLTSKGRSVNLKSATYKVIHCTGRVLASKAALETPAGHFLVLIGEPIPHPSNIEVPLDKQTFLTKHSLDMKYTYVDDKIANFLGYQPDDLEGKSAYEYHHSIDNEAVLKSYKTLLTKGQTQTPSYRFLARTGGYAWVQTQATLLYGARDSKPQAVVCVHSVLSGVEAEDEILSVNQMTAKAAGTTPVKTELGSVSCKASIQSENHVKPLRSVTTNGKVQRQPFASLEVCRPRATTANIFAPRTADMSNSFLMFDEKEGMTELKEEPEDLTHLAPAAGDACIPLDFPAFFSMAELFEDISLPATLDCLPLTGMEFPFESQQDSGLDDEESEKDSVYSATASVFRNDPFIDKPGPSPGLSDSELDILKPISTKNEDPMIEPISPYLSPASEKSVCQAGSYAIQRQNSLPQMESLDDDDFMRSPFTEVGSLETEDVSLYKEDMKVNLSHPPTIKKETCFESETTVVDESMEEEDEFDTRAPYIPMDDCEDLPLFDSPKFNWDIPLEDFMGRDQSFEEQALEMQATMAPKEGRSLAQLLQQESASASSAKAIKGSSVVFNTTSWRPNGLEPVFPEVNCPALGSNLERANGLGPVRKNIESLKRPFIETEMDTKLSSKKQKMGSDQLTQSNLSPMTTRLPAAVGTLEQMLMSGETNSSRIEGNRSSGELFTALKDSPNVRLAMAQGANAKRLVAATTTNSYTSRVKPGMSAGCLMEEAMTNTFTSSAVPTPKLNMTGGTVEDVWRRMSCAPKTGVSNAPASTTTLQQQQSSMPLSLAGRRMRPADSNSVLLNLLDVNKLREKPSSNTVRGCPSGIPLAATSSVNTNRASFSLIREEQSVYPAFYTKNLPVQRPFPAFQLRHDTTLPSVSASPGGPDLLTMLEMSLLDMADTRPHVL